MADIGVSFDALRIYDGNSSNATLLAEMSGEWDEYTFSSSGPQMFITFDSDERGFWVGFYATFSVDNFASQNKEIMPCTVENPCHAGEGQCYSHKQCDGTLKCGRDNCPRNSVYYSDDDCCYDYCGQWLDTSNGFIMSPEYPNPYNNFEECIWTISAEKNQTVVLQILHFEVSESL